MSTGSRPPRSLAALGILGALLSVGAQLDLVPWPVAVLPAAWLALVAAALPLILLWAPTEPSPLKLVLFSSLLSPALCGLLFAAGRSLAGVEQGLLFTALALGLLQGVALVRPWHPAPLGRAAWLTLLLGMLLGAACLLALLYGGHGLLLGGETAVEEAARARALLRPGAPEDPFLAGAPLGPGSPHEWVLAALGGLLGLQPYLVLGPLLAVGLACLPVCIYLAAAPLWRESKRCLLAPLVALLGTGLFVPGLEGLWPGGEPLLLAPWAAFLEPGPGPLALVHGAGALAAAVHAARHAMRPWTGLCASQIALCALLEPRLGVTLAVALLAAALVRPGRSGVRAPVLLAWTAALLPAALWYRPGGAELAGMAGAPEPGSVAHLLLLGQGPALLAAAGLFSGRWRAAGAGGGSGELRSAAGGADDAGRTTVLVLLLVLWIAATSITLGPELSPGILGLQLGALALGVLAAGGLGDLFEGGLLTRLLAGGLLLVLLAGGGLALLGAAGFVLERTELLGEDPGLLSLHPEGEQEPDWEQQQGLLGPEPPSNVYDPRAPMRRLVRWREDSRDLGRALTWLREERQGVLPAALVVAPASLGRDGLRRRPESLVIAADLPLWVAAAEPPADAAEGDAAQEASTASRQRARLEALEVLYGPGRGSLPGARQFRPDDLREAELLGRELWFVVEEEDRRRTTRDPDAELSGIEGRLLRVGAERVLVLGRVALYRWGPSRAPR